MSAEAAFLHAIAAHPDDAVSRLVYADWLEDHDDSRGQFLRLHLALRNLPPDHPHRTGGEHELSVLRRGLALDWLAVIEPERAYLSWPVPRNDQNKPLFEYASCTCFEAGYRKEN